MSTADRAILTAASEAGYLTLPSGRLSQRSQRLRDAWFDECERSERPYIFVTPAGSQAMVTMDLVSFRLDQHAAHQWRDRLPPLLLPLCRRYARRPHFYSGPVVAEVYVASEDAPAVALEYQRIALTESQ